MTKKHTLGRKRHAEAVAVLAQCHETAVGMDAFSNEHRLAAGPRSDASTEEQM